MTVIKGVEVEGLIKYHPNFVHNAIKTAKIDR